MANSTDCAYDRDGYLINPRTSTCICCHVNKEKSFFPRHPIPNICRKCRENQNVRCVNCNKPISFFDFGFSTTEYDCHRFFLCGACEGHEMCLGCKTTFPVNKMGDHRDSCVHKYYEELGKKLGINLPAPEDPLLVFAQFAFFHFSLI